MLGNRIKTRHPSNTADTITGDRNAKLEGCCNSIALECSAWLLAVACIGIVYRLPSYLVTWSHVS